jgi:hypothetical protein
MRTYVKGLLVVASFVLVPSMAHAQASIAGVIKDSSGAVLPGVTVEASSPALIEKVRTVVSDGTGQYKIVDLVAGTYSLKFTLPGFNTIERGGVILSGNFAASINADMKIARLKKRSRSPAKRRLWTFRVQSSPSSTRRARLYPDRTLHNQVVSLIQGDRGRARRRGERRDSDARRRANPWKRRQDSRPRATA